MRVEKILVIREQQCANAITEKKTTIFPMINHFCDLKWKKKSNTSLMLKNTHKFNVMSQEMYLEILHDQKVSLQQLPNNSDVRIKSNGTCKSIKTPKESQLSRQMRMEWMNRQLAEGVMLLFTLCTLNREIKIKFLPAYKKSSTWS